MLQKHASCSSKRAAAARRRRPRTKPAVTVHGRLVALVVALQHDGPPHLAAHSSSPRMHASGGVTPQPRRPA